MFNKKKLAAYITLAFTLMGLYGMTYAIQVAEAGASRR